MSSRQVAVGLRRVESEISKIGNEVLQSWTSIHGEVTGQIWAKGESLHIQPLCREISLTASEIRQQLLSIEALLSELDG